MTSTPLARSLRLHVRDLIGKPGQSRPFDLTVAAPADFAVRLIGVPEGSELRVEGLLESVHEGIFASGRVSVLAVGECGRCLDRIDLPVEVEFQELFAYSVEEAFDFFVEDDSVDLEQVVRDAVVLALPFQPVCREDCLGLCPECGAKLADDPAHSHDPAIDPRWSRLADLRIDTE